MKKHARKRPKKSRPKRRKTALDVLRDAPELGEIRRMLAKQLGLGGESVEDLLEDVLSKAKSIPSEEEFDEGRETLSELGDALDAVRLDANGGDAAARETLKRIGAAVDEAARRDEIHPAYLIMLGRVFAGAGLDVGEAARAAFRRALETTFPAPPSAENYRTFLAPLFSSGVDAPFDLFALADQMMSIFPTEHKIGMVEGMVAADNPLARRAAVGFVLHRDEALALAAIRALAPVGRLDAKSRRWIDLLRPWLTPARQSALAQAFGPAEPASVDGAPTANVVSLVAAVCDGTGGGGLMATLKRDDGFAVVSIMLKPTGVTDALLYDDIVRQEKDEIESLFATNAAASKVLPATFTKLLRLALGRNLAHDAPPPFALVHAVEEIGLGALAPDDATPAEILDALVADFPGRDDAEAIAEANDRLADDEIADQWYEASEEVDAALSHADSPEQGAEALLETYLPDRRMFWASQCALSALARKDSAGPNAEHWRDLALVGREIVRPGALARIPFMRRIASQSAQAYFQR